ncbi:MAG: hypothetical protein ABGU93_05450 [Acetobacterium sp.]|uniref:hypothetical protein n=1 Tax=Acetobacterium sp. TaxID=1872094 RepID=UPI00324282AA
MPQLLVVALVFLVGRGGMMGGWQGLVSRPGLFAKIIPRPDLEMAEQLLGIADHAEALAHCQLSHGRHHRGVHVAGEIAVKGFAGEVAGIGNAAGILVDRWAAAPGGDYQRPAEGVPELLGQLF